MEALLRLSSRELDDLFRRSDAGARPDRRIRASISATSPRADRRLFIPPTLSTCDSCLLMINSRKWHP